MAQAFEKTTLDVVFNAVTEEFADRVAIIFEERAISYRELRELVYSMACRLRELGVRKDEKIGILLPNCFEYLCLYLAAFLVGAWVVPINSRVKRKELRNILVDSDVRTLFFQAVLDNQDFASMLHELRGELPLLRDLIARGDEQHPGMLPMSAFLDVATDIEARIRRFTPAGLVEDDVALLAYTSGTTSTPKGVMITHRGLVQTSQITGRLWGLDHLRGDEIALSVAPLYAAQGFLAVFIDLCNGVTMHWLSSFNPNEIIRAISKGRARLFHTQPTMWSLLLSSPLAKFANFKTLEKTVVSGSLCSRNLAERIEAATGSVPLNAYGLIEATGVVTATRPDDPREVRLSTVGRPIPGVEVRIVDKDRRSVEPGDTGEVAIRGYVMKGYYKNEARTREVMDDEGWLYSGDLGRFYEGGENIQIVGRAREMIIRGGFNVYPIDIEEQLLLLDGVQDAAVVGRSDEILGEAIVAFVVPKPGQRLTKGDLLRRVRENLSNHKLPDEVYFVRQLPTILSGKVLKNVLREWADTEVPCEELELS